MHLFYKLKPIQKFKRYNSVNIQYVSDVHVDYKNYIPNIKPEAKYLVVCGDLGVPTHDNVKKFININSKQFERIFIVAGNHDYGCSAVYNDKHIDFYKKTLQNECNIYDNVHFLDKTHYALTQNIMIAGTTLWSSSKYILDSIRRIDHNNEHRDNVKWIEMICNVYPNKQIIMATHYVPTFQLIEPKYLKHGIKNTSVFATDLEHLIKKPIAGWLCGHTHSVLEKEINGVYCGVNALGHSNNECETKIITVDDVCRE